MSEDEQTYRGGPKQQVDYIVAGKALQQYRLSNKVVRVMSHLIRTRMGTLAEVMRRKVLIMGPGDLVRKIHRHNPYLVPRLTLPLLIRYERGKLSPYRQHLEAIEELLDIPKGDLLRQFGYKVSDPSGEMRRLLDEIGIDIDPALDSLLDNIID